MKKITILLMSVFCSFSFGQNLIVNGDFEAGEIGALVPSWGGFKNRIANDNITISKVGQIENGDGSLFQEFPVTAGEEYNVKFDYRWLTSASANSTMIVRIKDAANLAPNLPLVNANLADGFTLNTEVDVWHDGEFNFEAPEGVSTIRILFYKANGNKPLNLDNVVVVDAASLSTNNLEKFNFKLYPNPSQNYITVSASNNIENIEIFNVLGQRVLIENPNLNTKQINISELKKGVYLIRTTINNISGTYKFVKE